METIKNNPLPGGGKKLLIWAGRILACGIPGLLLGLELVGLVFGSLRLNWGAFLFQILIPALVLLRLILLFRSSRSSGSKCGRAVVWTVLILLWSTFGVVFCSIFLPLEFHKVIRENPWEEFRTEENEWFVKYEPRIEGLDPGETETMELHRCSRSAAIFETNADILLCTYSPEAYTRQKAFLADSLDYQEEPMQAWSFEEEASRSYEPVVQIGDDEFRFLKAPEKTTPSFYKTSVITVTNDRSCQIAFIYYTDTEMDGIDNMTDFLEEDCFWSFIR